MSRSDAEAETQTPGALADFDRGFILGLLVGEGHFGGDGRKAQVTLRMHTRHESLFRWLLQAIPGSRLYGPYHHGGRSYFQWMARGSALKDHVLPLVLGQLSFVDAHVRGRIEAMCARYGIDLDRAAEANEVR
jgi:hypothetical protein